MHEHHRLLVKGQENRIVALNSTHGKHQLHNLQQQSRAQASMNMDETYNPLTLSRPERFTKTSKHPLQTHPPITRPQTHPASSPLPSKPSPGHWQPVPRPASSSPLPSHS